MATPADRLAYQLFVGVDIAATTFTATWSRAGQPDLRPMTFHQTSAGFAAFQQQLQQTDIARAATLIVMEATGSYWITLAVTLHEAGYVVSVVNAAQIHDYVKSLPRKGKTDALDAIYLTQFAAERRPNPWTPPPAVYHELRQRLAARDAFVEMRKLAQNHRHALSQWPIVVGSVLSQLDQSIADLNRRMQQLEDQLAAILQDSAWAESAALVLSISGIGRLTAAWLLVTTLTFTIAATPESLAAYAGLAPLPHDSGSSVRGRRQIGHAGNRRLRTALYLATLSAAQHNPVIAGFTSACVRPANQRKSRAVPPLGSCCNWPGRWSSTSARLLRHIRCSAGPKYERLYSNCVGGRGAAAPTTTCCELSTKEWYSADRLPDIRSLVRPVVGRW